MRARFVNEELLGSIKDMDKHLEIFKNPPSVKRMDAFARAYSDEQGNFYVASLKGERDSKNYDDIVTTHTHITKFLKDEGHIDNDIKWVVLTSGYGTYSKGLSWQRYESSNNWCLGESTHDGWINDNMNKIQDVIKKIESHGIKYLNLIPIRISVYEDHQKEFSDVDAYHRSQAHLY